jgi:hypothetical protein
MNMEIPTFDEWLHEMLRLLLYPLGDGFFNHLAMVGVILFVMWIVGSVFAKMGTDENAPFDLE